MSDETKTTGRKTVSTKQPKIHAALASVLSNMSVAKGGMLPGNMGGKPYITAVDLAAEAKRQFVENGIIFVPNEEVTKHEVLTDGNRKTVVVGIRGEYTLIHVEDGSSLTISGIGDGLATGTAVASNIASTNAQKNALLRTFMVTEQSAEDAAKNGVPEQTPQSQAINKARQPQVPAKGDGNWHQKIVKEIINNPEDDRGKDDVNALLSQILKEKKLTSNDANRTKVYPELYERLKAGEVAA